MNGTTQLLSLLLAGALSAAEPVLPAPTAQPEPAPPAMAAEARAVAATVTTAEPTGTAEPAEPVEPAEPTDGMDVVAPLPEGGEALAPENGEAAAPEISDMLAPGAGEVLSPEAEELAVPEAEELAAPEADKVIAPEASEVVAPGLVGIADTSQGLLEPPHERNASAEDGAAQSQAVHGTFEPGTLPDEDGPASLLEALGTTPQRLLPRPLQPHGQRAIAFFLLTLLAASVAQLAERPLQRLATTGLLPALLQLVVVGSRLAALLLAFVGLLYLVPAAWSPAVPYVLIGGALAAGWSFRDVTRDSLVWITLLIERNLRLGQRITVGDVSGELQRITVRTVHLRDDMGRDVAIPNRLLTTGTVTVDPDPFPPIVVPVFIPGVHPAVEVRQQLTELVLLIPYLAPQRPPQICRSSETPGLWVIKARLVRPGYADAFRGALVDLVEEVYGQPSEGTKACESDGTGCTKS